MGAASVLQDGSNGPARWSLRLLGDFQLFDRGSGEKVVLPGKRERVLLAYLALSPGGRQPRRKLVTLLWGEAADETMLDNLRTAVFNLRKALGDADRSIVASEDRDIVLDASAFEVDVLAVRRLAAGSGVAELEGAAKLYAGDFLDGLSIESEEFESWRREESTRCRGQVLDALTRLMGQLAASGEHERAIETGLRILRLEPLHEVAVRSLMRLYAGNGRRAAAAELYRTLAETLKKELGAQPEAETRAVYAEIAHGDRAPSTDAKPPSKFRAPTLPSDMRSAASPADHLAREPDRSGPVAGPNVKRRTIGWVLGGGLAVAAAIALLLFGPFAPSSDEASGVVPGTVVASTPTNAIALAVLPFANLSTEQDQDFFSDGLTEEITSALAKVPDLRIVARTSAFEFKGQNRNIRTIGEQLGATHLIEGSVRRAGDRVRITVQLIRADDGTHIWSDDYDRQLTDIFAIQEDIAKSIAEALAVPLGLQQGEKLVQGTPNLSTYQSYLQAKEWLRERNTPRGGPYLQTLESIVAREPSFAPAWALLARVYQTQISGNARVAYGPIDEARRIVQTLGAKAEMAAQKALELNPRHPSGYWAMANIKLDGGQWAAAAEFFEKGLAIDPNDPDLLNGYSTLLLRSGHLKQSLSVSRKLEPLEPLIANYKTNMGLIMVVNGQNDAAIELLESIPSNRRSAFVHGWLARALAGKGRNAEGADMMLASLVPPNLVPGIDNRKGIEDAAGVLRAGPIQTANQDALPSFGHPEGELLWVYATVHAYGRVLNYAEREVQIQYLTDFGKHIWGPESAPLRKMDRFKTFVRDAGLLDYWRAKGWPDLCRPVGADDFVCG